MKIRLSLVSAAALALAACGSQEPADAPADDLTADETALPEPAPAPDPTTPQGFADTVAASDMYEIEAGRLAQDMGQSEAVKSFAAMMIEDHTTSSDNLREAAGQADNVVVAPALTPKQESDLEALRNAGENFDTVYAQQQVAAHEAALSVLQDYAQSGTVEPLKAFASQTATVVEGHLGEARDLP